MNAVYLGVMLVELLTKCFQHLTSVLLTLTFFAQLLFCVNIGSNFTKFGHNYCYISELSGNFSMPKLNEISSPVPELSYL